jgi:hypothetical protein
MLEPESGALEAVLEIYRGVTCTLLALIRKSLIINGAGEGNRTLVFITNADQRGFMRQFEGSSTNTAVATTLCHYQNCWPRSTVGIHFGRLRVGRAFGFCLFHKPRREHRDGRGKLAPAKHAGPIPARGSPDED